MIPAERPRRARRSGPHRLERHLTVVAELPLEFRRRTPTYEAATILEAAAAAVRSNGLTPACSVMGVAPPLNPKCGTCIYCRIRTATDEVYPGGVDVDAVVLAHQAVEDHGLHADPRPTREEATTAVIDAAYDLYNVTLPPDVQIVRTL